MSISGDPSSIASEIKAKADLITNFLVENGETNLSFALGSPPTPPLPLELQIQKAELFQLMDDLKALLEGPIGHVISTTGPTQFNAWTAIQSLEESGVAKKLPVGSCESIETIAERCGRDPQDLAIYLRAAVANHVLEEPRKGFFRHNAASAAIARSPELRSWMQYTREDMIPAALHSFDAIAAFPGSSEPSEAGFALSLQRAKVVTAAKEAAAAAASTEGADSIANPPLPTLQGYFESMPESPLRARRFEHAMKIIDKAAWNDPAHLARNLGPRAPTSTLVDIGGSSGAVGMAIARHHAGLHVIVEDLPDVVNDATAAAAAMAQTDSDLAGRVSFRAQNFFEEQQVRGADIYLFRNVLHDWPDAYARRILRALVPAMRPGARVLLNEVCLPEQPDTEAVAATAPSYRSRLAFGFGLSLKTMFNGKERDEGEWRRLLAEADERFVVVEIKRPPLSRLAIIEIHWRG